MAIPSLLQTHSVPLYRHAGEGWYDEENNYVAPTPTTSTLICNIQPYREGDQSFRLDEGFRNTDAIILRSPTLLKASDDIGQELADEIEYLGKRFYCKTVGNFLGYGLPDLEHYEVLFYRKDKV